MSGATCGRFNVAALSSWQAQRDRRTLSEAGEEARADIGQYRANLQGEIDGAAIYRTMAAAETNPALQELYRRLAETEARHGGI